jgi:3-polyprenyl-4-hydroxybenzoate decarboxylase
MPEFPGYCGEAEPSLPVIKVKAVTMRNHAILQTLVGPGKSIPPGRFTDGSQHPQCR